jgi:hypothetical protein
MAAFTAGLYKVAPAAKIAPVFKKSFLFDFITIQFTSEATILLFHKKQ